jgi:hypothetical protein
LDLRAPSVFVDVDAIEFIVFWLVKKRRLTAKSGGVFDEWLSATSPMAI